jgi:hypothetical protein
LHNGEGYSTQILFAQNIEMCDLHKCTRAICTVVHVRFVQMHKCDLHSCTVAQIYCSLAHISQWRRLQHTQNTKYKHKIQNTKWRSEEGGTMQREPVADSRSAKYTFGTHIYIPLHHHHPTTT